MAHQLEALYVVQFGDVEAGGRYRPAGGVVVLKGGRIYGGDAGYYYIGSYTEAGEGFRIKVRIVKYDPTAKDAFGDTVASFEVEAELTQHGEIIQGQMARVEQPDIKLPIRLIWKEDVR